MADLLAKSISSSVNNIREKNKNISMNAFSFLNSAFAIKTDTDAAYIYIHAYIQTHVKTDALHPHEYCSAQKFTALSGGLATA